MITILALETSPRYIRRMTKSTAAAQHGPGSKNAEGEADERETGMVRAATALKDIEASPPPTGIDPGVGDRIKSLRETKKLTQSDLAKRVEKSRACVAQWEANRSHPDITMYAKLALHLDSTSRYIAFGEIDGDPNQVAIPVVQVADKRFSAQIGAISVPRDFLERIKTGPQARIRALRLDNDIAGLRKGDYVIIDEANTETPGRGEAVLFGDTGNIQITKVAEVPGTGSLEVTMYGSKMHVSRQHFEALGRVVGKLGVD